MRARIRRTQPACRRPPRQARGASARRDRVKGQFRQGDSLERLRRATGLPILTDVHLPEQCAPAAEVVDVLQIPAFLCRQTDLLLAAGATGKPVNVKKGQWMHPEGMRGAVEKVRSAMATGNGDRGSGGQAPSSAQSLVPSPQSPSRVAVTERGSFFGYGCLVVDMRCFTRMREACNAPVIFDGTHSVQRPGMGEGGASGGAREFIAALTRAAIAAGADGLFLETHPDPDHAPSDGPNMLHLSSLDTLVARVVDLWYLCRQGSIRLSPARFGSSPSTSTAC